jgi:hypothetical protein
VLRERFSWPNLTFQINKNKKDLAEPSLFEHFKKRLNYLPLTVRISISKINGVNGGIEPLPLLP